MLNKPNMYSDSMISLYRRELMKTLLEGITDMCKDSENEFVELDIETRRERISMFYPKSLEVEFQYTDNDGEEYESVRELSDCTETELCLLWDALKEIEKKY